MSSADDFDPESEPRVPSSFPPPPPRARAGTSDSGALEQPAGVRGRRVIAVGGGRGGVGKTLLSINLGVYFAQLGREVVVCDADPFASNLHAVLGHDAPPLVLPDALDEESKTEPVPTSVPGLRILPTPYDPMTATPLRTTRGSQFIRQIQSLEADYVLVNLGASTAPATLDLFLHADVGLSVTAPEPFAVEATYRFLRALYARALRRALMKERFKLRLVERALDALPPLSGPRDIVATIRRFDDGVAATAALEMARLCPRLVVGQTRLRSDLELGPAMAAVSSRFLGIGLDYIGHIEHDDAVWLTARRRQPLLIDSPTSKSARNIERVARRILALLAAQSGRASDVQSIPPSGRRDAIATLYDTLGVTRAATDDEIRRAFKRQREIFRDGSLPVASVVGPAVLRQEQARIEEAYDTLLDPVRRRAYDLSAFPDDPPVSIAPQRAATAAAAAELAMLQADLAREINAETQFSGALLRKVRESQGIEISDIAQRTKISSLHIAAIENEAAADLPAAVYVQGFVQEVAKFLKLDPAQVQKTYMRRLREVAAGSVRAGPGSQPPRPPYGGALAGRPRSDG